MKPLFVFFLSLTAFFNVTAQNDSLPYVLVLGVAQDGGYPHIGCRKKCCVMAWQTDSLKKNVVSLALVDPLQKKWWLFEATPDITSQLHLFASLTKSRFDYLPAGIFITHAHIGHYTGLMQLGREALGAKEVPVYTLPKLKTFLETNGPWEQLVKLKNIKTAAISPDSLVTLSPQVSVKAFTVPHRDEYSETAGFVMVTSARKYLFIPDIDKWEKWGRNIVDEVKQVDVALLDATFYSQTELPDRNMKEVLHPFVVETAALFRQAPAVIKQRVTFIHFNHTNPLLWDKQVRQDVQRNGFSIATQGAKL